MCVLAGSSARCRQQIKERDADKHVRCAQTNDKQQKGTRSCAERRTEREQTGEMSRKQQAKPEWEKAFDAAA